VTAAGAWCWESAARGRRDGIDKTGTITWAGRQVVTTGFSRRNHGSQGRESTVAAGVRNAVRSSSISAALDT